MKIATRAPLIVVVTPTDRLPFAALVESAILTIVATGVGFGSARSKEKTRGAFCCGFVMARQRRTGKRDGRVEDGCMHA